MPTTREIALCASLAALALTPAAALAKHGADDGGGRAADDRGALRADSRGLDDAGGLRDESGDRRARGSKDKPGEKRVAGRCTARSSAKLKAKHDDGRIEVEFEVDQNRSGVKWTVRLRRNGDLVVSTRATTRPPSGSFSVERRIADRRGSDRISATATSPSGETCKASVTI
jgi:hypothetical protein